MRSKKGFTLIELLAVIMLASIIFPSITYLYLSLSNNAIESSKRLAIHDRQLFSQHYIYRYLYNALPISFSLSNDSTCLRFTNITNSGTFLTAGKQSNDYSVQLMKVPSSETHYLIAVDDANRFSEKMLYKVLSIDNDSVRLTKKLSQESLRSSGFLLLSEYRAFCVVNDEIRFYKNITHSNVAINYATPYEVVAKGLYLKNKWQLNPKSDFALEVIMDWMWGDESESFNAYHKVVVDYVR